MGDIFIEKTNRSYDLRNNDGLMVPRANTTAHSIDHEVQRPGAHIQILFGGGVSMLWTD